MNDVQRDIGGLEARMDEHAKRFDILDGKIDDGLGKLDAKIESGFAGVNERLAILTAKEDRREGAMGLVKVAIGSAGLYGLWELVKSAFHR